jgi:hypothetical protein
MKKYLSLISPKPVAVLLIIALLLLFFVLNTNRASEIFASEQQTRKHFEDSIAGVLKRIDAAQEVAAEYQVAAWEKFGSPSPVANDLIDAKLYVSWGEIHEFTTGEDDRARGELEKAESSLKKAESHVDQKTKAKLTALINQIAATKAEVGQNRADQRERYMRLESTLSDYRNAGRKNHFLSALVVRQPAR